MTGESGRKEDMLQQGKAIQPIFKLAGLALLLLPRASAQINSIQLFSPVNVRPSPTGTAPGNPTTFNSTTLNLDCTVSPIVATLTSVAAPPSTTDFQGPILVDNHIILGVTANGQTTIYPLNICGTGSSTNGVPNCYTSSYQGSSLVGQDPDTLVATDGTGPFYISWSLNPGVQQLTLQFQSDDQNVANSTVYLNTNCTLNGVTGPATVSGNPISQSGPTSTQLTQDFSFNPATNQSIGFEYDLSAAQSAGTLTINDQTIPHVTDGPLDPTAFQPTWATGTSFATSNCLVHSGEALANGNPACKLYTLECSVGTGTTSSGAQCPVSSLNNEVVQDVFDGPAFTLQDVSTPGGVAFHEGMGLLMASEGWTGGPCTFDPASGLENLPCPLNLLASFSGPGTFEGDGRTTHPNSTFISVAGVLEDLTSLTVNGMHPGNWINTSSAGINFSSQPPNIAGTSLPGAANFVPSPIQSITYGISPANNVPQAGGPVAGDQTITNPAGCPTPANPQSPAATTFVPAVQTVSGLSDGNYQVHYFAQDCAGTLELKFAQDASNAWSTNFYTFPINVDTVPPVVASGPTLSPAPSALGTYTVNEPVMATYSCTDDRSGVVKCGTQAFAPGASNSTGPLNSAVDTSSPGMKTFTVTAIDAAGNQASKSVSYQVAPPFDSQIQLTVTPTTSTYPLGPAVQVHVLNINGFAPTGSIQLLDGTTQVGTLRLVGGGLGLFYLTGLAAGSHSVTAVYSGDAHNAGGTSQAVAFTVLPAPVKLLMTCGSPSIPAGANYGCLVFAGAGDDVAQGYITYQLDKNAPVNVPLIWGFAVFTLQQPALGPHTITVSYPAQPNFLAATPQSVTFNVLPKK